MLAGKHFHYNYTTVAMTQLPPHYDWKVRLLLNQIMKSSCAKNMTKIELKTKFMELSFNVMTMMVVGKRYRGEDVGDAEEAKNLREVIRDAWIDLGVEKKMAGLMAKLDKFLQGLVNEGRVILSSTNCSSDEKGVKKLMIDNLLSMQETQPQILLVAGTDTTSTTLEWAMALLVNHPEVMEKTQRLYPPVPLLVPHEASEDCVVGGFDVPRHTMLVINSWAIHRNPEVWEDPTEFRPEKFEEWSGEGSEGYKLRVIDPKKIK
ncbi:hypothetical protein PRUPE_1G428500 [Prunus persica]|uniref:Cytochrome P450 n=1 Tax=Prunus persica TaxID=3760 RepID=A0A251RBV7_PRUPE|nr:hypothetical protein PRUPE_1G428500 [Prunus persica]